MTAHPSPARLEHARRVLANAEALAENLLIHPRDLVVSVGCPAEDIRLIASEVQKLAGRLEATLNRAVDAVGAEATARVMRDMIGNVETVTEALAELVSLMEHVADEIDENDSQPVEYEYEDRLEAR